MPSYRLEHRETTKIFHLMCHHMPFWCGIRCKTFLENYGCGCVWAVHDTRGLSKGWFSKRVVFQRMFSQNENRNEGTSDVPPERNQNEGTFACSSGTKNRNQGTFAKTTLLNRPFCLLSTTAVPNAYSLRYRSQGMISCHWRLRNSSTLSSIYEGKSSYRPENPPNSTWRQGRPKVPFKVDPEVGKNLEKTQPP